MKIKCTKIEYDTEGENVKLPPAMTVEIDDVSYACLKEDSDELKEEIGDIISERTEFCVLDFEYKVLNA